MKIYEFIDEIANEIRKEQEKLRGEIKNIKNQSNIYTSEYIDNKISSLNAEYKPKVQQAEKTINDYLKKVISEIRKKSNLEKEITVDDFYNLQKTLKFIDDFNVDLKHINVFIEQFTSNIYLLQLFFSKLSETKNIAIKDNFYDLYTKYILEPNQELFLLEEILINNNEEIIFKLDERVNNEVLTLEAMMKLESLRENNL